MPNKVQYDWRDKPVCIIQSCLYYSANIAVICTYYSSRSFQKEKLRTYNKKEEEKEKAGERECWKCKMSSLEFVVVEMRMALWG